MVKWIYLYIKLKCKKVRIHSLSAFITEAKLCVVFLGVEKDDGKRIFSGTGALIRISGINHMITAKHVLVDRKTKQIRNDLSIFFNTKSGTVGRMKIEDLMKEVNIVFHPNPKVDVVMVPFAHDGELDTRYIVDSFFLSFNEIEDGAESFFLSYQPGLESDTRINPIIRSGIVSVKNEDKTFYIDGSAFPGNSGSPVFSKETIEWESDTSLKVIPNPKGRKFLGVIGSYLPYKDIAVSQQTGEPRIVFEEHTGLSRVWSCDFIREIENTHECKSQIEKILKGIQEEAENNKKLVK